MAGLDNQRLAYEFLLECFESQRSFSAREFQARTNWKASTFSTYQSKQFRPFLQETAKGQYRVTEAYRKYADWKAFREHVSQVRAGSGDYTPFSRKNILIFDFYMPLKNEAELRTTLDSLFYKDTIVRRLKWKSLSTIAEFFPRKKAERDADYLERVCTWIGEKFRGYSINHVMGRFRMGDLATREQVFARSPHSNRYLTDETTAVTRFMFPCSDSKDVERTTWFFKTLFVESIIELVSGEEEIWLVETGINNEIHVWELERQD